MSSFLSARGSGGISLKPSPSMDAMRADMGGAATVCASVVTAAALKLPINIIGGFYGAGQLEFVNSKIWNIFHPYIFFFFPPGSSFGSTVWEHAQWEGD